MGKKIVPEAKPRLSSTELKRKITHFNIDRIVYPVLIIGIIGYYLNTICAPLDSNYLFHNIYILWRNI